MISVVHAGPSSLLSGLVGMFDWKVSGSKLVEHRGDPKSPPHVSQNTNLVCEKNFIFKFIKIISNFSSGWVENFMLVFTGVPSLYPLGSKRC